MMGVFTVTVRSGDTLSAIALDLFGDAAKSHEIYLQNKTLLDAHFEQYQRTSRWMRLFERTAFYGKRRIQRAEDCLVPGMQLRVHVPPVQRDPPENYPVWVDARALLQDLDNYPASSPVHYHELRNLLEAHIGRAQERHTTKIYRGLGDSNFLANPPLPIKK